MANLPFGHNWIPQPEKPIEQTPFAAPPLVALGRQQPRGLGGSAMALSNPQQFAGSTRPNMNSMIKTGLGGSVPFSAMRAMSSQDGVRPGMGTNTNAVQAARNSGAAGPPTGMAGRNMNDPRNAALAGGGGR